MKVKNRSSQSKSGVQIAKFLLMAAVAIATVAVVAIAVDQSDAGFLE